MTLRRPDRDNRRGHALDRASIGRLLISKGNEVYKPTDSRSYSGGSPESHYRGNGIVVTAAKYEVADFILNATTVQNILNNLGLCAAEWNKGTSILISSH